MQARGHYRQAQSLPAFIDVVRRFACKILFRPSFLPARYLLKILASGGTFEATDLQHIELGTLFVDNKRLLDIRLFHSSVSEMSGKTAGFCCFTAFFPTQHPAIWEDSRSSPTLIASLRRQTVRTVARLARLVHHSPIAKGLPLASDPYAYPPALCSIQRS